MNPDSPEGPVGWASKPHKSWTTFAAKWGDDIEKRGYVSVPHELTKRVGEFGLSPSEFLILVCILGLGERYCAASTLVKWSGLSLKTVRKCVVSLENKGFIERVYWTGNANQFDVQGTVQIVRQTNLEKGPASSRWIRDR